MISRSREREVFFSLPCCLCIPPRSTTALALLIALVLAPVSSAVAARRPDFRLLKATELPTIGLKVNVMPQVREAPLPPPSVFTYTFTEGARSWKSDMYAPYELWLHSQLANRWVDEHSNTLIIATLTLALPKGGSTPHVTREDYEKQVADLQKQQTPWTAETISQWVADFVGAESTKAQSIAKRPSNLQDLLAFSIPGQPTQMAYVFRLNRAASGQSRAVTTWFLALFDINPEISRDSAHATIAADFLAKLTSSKTAPPAAAGPSKTFQTPPTSKTVSRSPEFIASRNQVANSIKSMKDWWYVETANYIILSNLRTRHRIMVKELQEDVECLRAVFEQFMPPRKDVTAVSVIRVFAEAAEYEAYVPAAFSWSSGIWMSDRKELVIKPADWGGNKEQREAVKHTVYHEAFHQYIFYAFDQLQPMAWFNEGYATFFGGASIGRGKLEVTEDPYRLRCFEERLSEGPLQLDQFLRLSYEQFYDKDKKILEQNYALAWALVYYLRKGAVLEKPAPYARILDRYGDALWQTRDAEKATDAAFDGIDIAKFEQDFVKFWGSKNRRSSAERNKIFRDYNPDAAGSP